MSRNMERARGHILLVGDSPEVALVASILGATRMTDDPTMPEISPVIWVASAYDIAAHYTSMRIDKVVVEKIHTGLIEVISRRLGGQSHRVVTAAGELERYFGRVSLDATSHISLRPTQERGGGALWQILEKMLALVAFVPIVVLLLILYGSLVICGATRILQRRNFVGKAEQIVSVVVFAPAGIPSTTSIRAFLARSLDRQIRRLHLTMALGLLAVMQGRVSLVGPTLLSPEAFTALTDTLPAARLRTLVRPGLVSLARVRMGRPQSVYDQRRALEYDLYYIKYQSLGMNVRIVIRAALILLTDLVRTTWRNARTAFSLALLGPVKWRRLAGASTASRLTAPTMPGRADTVGELLPTLVVGAGSGGAQLIRDLQSNTELGLWPVAVVDDDLAKLGSRVGGVPVLGTSESIEALATRERVERIIVAIPSAGEVARKRLTDLAQSAGKPVLTMPSLYALLDGANATDLVNVAPSDLLGRKVVEIDPAQAKAFLGGKCVLVTGAAGSIGREVVIQALRGDPAVIYGLDLNESDLYDLQQDLRRSHPAVTFVPIVASVTDRHLVERLFQQIQPQVVFHAAAYKHVPLMEDYPHEAVRTNIAGTWIVATTAASIGVERFVLVSTDKAVRPSSVMGASKRIAELVVREVAANSGLSACSVRFGNVLGSRGSVIPLFERQIEAGGPITITDKRMTRYFMTIPEAAGLIIEAGAFGDQGVVYMLDMAEPVKIVDVAERLIRLKGLQPGVDISIAYTGLRPGEKLFEELSLDFEQAHPTPHSKIRILDEGEFSRRISAIATMHQLLDRIDRGETDGLRDAILRKVQIADGLDLTLVGDDDKASCDHKRSVS